MAWSYEQKFNDLNDGDLNEQDSWSGDVSFDVETTTKYEGAKAVENVAQNKTINRTITAIDEGSFYVAVRMSVTPATNQTAGFNLYSGATQICYIRMGNAGTGFEDNIVLYSDTGGGMISFYDGIVANQWYVVNVEFDDANYPDQYRARAHDGTSWGDWTDWKPTRAAYTTIDTLQLIIEYFPSGTFYWDTITPTNPAPFFLNLSDAIGLADAISKVEKSALNLTETLSLQDTISKIGKVFLSLIETLTLKQSGKLVGNLWHTLTKHIASWTKGTKHTASWTYKSKSASPTWAKQTKH